MIAITIIVVSIVLISFYFTPDIKATSDLTISTDKIDYNEGEIINIVVKNELDKPILYYNGADKFWGIEYLKESNWINPAYEKGGGFQLTEEGIGDDCYILLYERGYPLELKSQSSISSQWNQKICPFGTGSPAEPRAIKYIGSGEYRLVFNYGFEISDDDPFRILDYKTIYSNNFNIN